MIHSKPEISTFFFLPERIFTTSFQTLSKLSLSAVQLLLELVFLTGISDNKYDPSLKVSCHPAVTSPIFPTIVIPCHFLNSLLSVLLDGYPKDS